MTSARRRPVAGRWWVETARVGATLALLAGLAVLVLTGLSPAAAAAVPPGVPLSSSASSFPADPGDVAEHHPVLELRAGHLDQKATVPAHRVAHPLRHHLDQGTPPVTVGAADWSPCASHVLPASEETGSAPRSVVGAPVGPRAPPGV